MAVEKKKKKTSRIPLPSSIENYSGSNYVRAKKEKKKKNHAPTFETYEQNETNRSGTGKRRKRSRKIYKEYHIGATFSSIEITHRVAPSPTIDY